MSEEDLKPKELNKASGLSEKAIQAFSLIMLVFLVVYDKVLNQIVPPLPEYWYIGLFAVGVLGTQATSVAKKFLK